MTDGPLPPIGAENLAARPCPDCGGTGAFGCEACGRLGRMAEVRYRGDAAPALVRLADLLGAARARAAEGRLDPDSLAAVEAFCRRLGHR